MDAFTDVVQLLRPKTVLMGAMVAHGDWGVQVPAQPGPMLYLVTAGACWFWADGGEALRVRAGDFILSANPVKDVFLSGPGERPVLSDDAFKARHMVDGEIRIGEAGQGEATRILGGVIFCEETNADLLSEMMPRLVHVQGGDGPGARLATLVALIREEAAQSGPGSDLILSRLIEVLLIETLRREAARLPHPGMLRGLADPQLARALADIHANVRRGWTIAELAQKAGMSRSAFARRFSEAVGLAPVEYLLRWRMALAKDALSQGRGSLEEIAETIGYRSASAFSTAFSRKVGCPPSEYARSRTAH